VIPAVILSLILGYGCLCSPGWIITKEHEYSPTLQRTAVTPFKQQGIIKRTLGKEFEMSKVRSFPPEAETRQHSAFLSQLHTGKKCPFCGLFSSMLFTLLCSSLVILLFTMAPKCSAEGLAIVLQEDVICLQNVS